MRALGLFGFLLSVALVVLLLVRLIDGDDGARASEVVSAGGKQYRITIALDRVGVLAKRGASDADVRRALAKGNQKVTKVSQRIYVVELGKKSREQLNALAGDLRTGNAGVVAKAGLVVTAPGSPRPSLLTDELIVTFKPSTPAGDVKQRLADPDVQFLARNPLVENEYLARVPPGRDADALSASNPLDDERIVEYAQPNFISTDAPRAAEDEQWHLVNPGGSGYERDADIDAKEAWELTEGRRSTVIAVIDAGFYPEHPDLEANLLRNAGEIAANDEDDDGNGFVDDFHGWDFTPCVDDESPSGCGDPDVSAGGRSGAHGTGAAALAGAKRPGVSGVCPACRLVLIRKPDDNGDYTRGLAFDYAVARGAQVISNSWGGVPPVCHHLCQKLEAAAEQRVVLLAMDNADRNTCGDEGGPTELAALDAAIAVSKSTEDDRRGRGGWGSCLDLLAPGTGDAGVTTADLPGAAGFNSEVKVPTCKRSELSETKYTACYVGTSAATPIVAGTAGLVLSANADLGPEEVRLLLQDTADKIQPTSSNYSPYGRGPKYGWGRVNAFEAVRVAAPRALGGRGGRDLFVRDGPFDWGNTEQPSHQDDAPPADSVDIKVDTAAGGWTPHMSRVSAFIEHDSENVVEGKPSRVYVRVRNRGPTAVATAIVKLLWTQRATGTPQLPDNFWSRDPENSGDQSVWHPAGTKEISDVAYSGASYSNRDDYAARVVRFDIPGLALSGSGTGKLRLLAIVGSQTDPPSTNSLDPAKMVRADNNVAWRKVAVNPAPE